MTEKRHGDEELWRIIHIPDNPPFLPQLQPTVNAYASIIDPKHANTIVRKLNQIAPLENLRHVKRVHMKFVEVRSYKVEDSEKISCESNGCHSVVDRPYLCTGYDIYLVWEPCIILQGQKSLNHHYAVFRVLLPEGVLGEGEGEVVIPNDKN